jgi:predicted lactoylglutathione lyase
MGRMIFPNLPVKDLPATVEFWKALGFEFNDRFSNDDAACLVINEQASVMLLREQFFHGFHDTRPHTGTETLIALSANSREEVDELCTAAAEAGAAETGYKVDEPPMYAGSFRDLDGHIWEVLWMDIPAA